MKAAPTRADMARALFAHLEAEGVEYVVPGPEGDGDLDLVVAPERLAEVPAILGRFGARHGVRALQALRHEPGATYYALAWLGGDGLPRFLHPDISADYGHAGRRLIAARTLLDGRRRAPPTVFAGAAPFVPAPAPAFLYYLVKKAEKGAITAAHGAHLAALVEAEPGAVTAILEGRIGDDLAQRTLAALQAADRAGLAALLPALRGAFRAGRPVAWAAEARRRLGRIAHPTGLVVAVLGPDGVGKSTLIAGLAQALAPAFRATAMRHLRPGVLLGGRGAATASPHGAAPRGALASAAKLALFAADYWIGFVGDLGPRRVRSTLIIFDRYLDDLAVDRRRYRLAAGAPARAFAALVPGPDVWLILDAPAAVVRARKPELERAAIERLRARYRVLTTGLPRAHVIDAARPTEAVVAEAAGIVLDHLARRFEARHGG